MARTSNLFKTAKSSTTSMSQTDLSALIQKKAYELWEKRGRKAGHATEDWVEAERIVRGRTK